MYLNDYMVSHNCFNMKGESTIKQKRLKYYTFIIKSRKLNLLLAKQKLIYLRSLNNYLPDDLIEKIIEDYIISNNNILYKRVINECIFITKKQYIKYYKLFDKPNNIYGRSWNFDNLNSNKIIRPHYKIIYNLQILPYLFDKHSNKCNCDRCLYNIDFPRIRYLLDKYNNPQTGHNSSYYNNYIKFILYCHITRGLNYINFKNKHYHKNNIILGFNRNNKFQHIILKNNKSKWKQLTNLYHLYS